MPRIIERVRGKKKKRWLAWRPTLCGFFDILCNYNTTWSHTIITGSEHSLFGIYETYVYQRKITW
jgi:uncharacterized cysteine cluster protein YcgN (CxxCxxCC family)